MGDIVKRRRPKMCPHKDCRFILNFQDAICGGELPSPVPHDGVDNTHRLCLFEEPGTQPYDLMINKTDAWWIKRAFSQMFGGGK